MTKKSDRSEILAGTIEEKIGKLYNIGQITDEQYD